MCNNTTIDKVERITQNKVVKFFKDPHYLNYKYLGNLIDKENSNIRTDSLIRYLRTKNFSDDVMRNAVTRVREYAT